MSETCEFGTLRDSLIKDRVVLGTKNKQVRVTLLNQKELTLDKALSVCRSSEITEQHLLKVNDNSTSNINSLQMSYERKENGNVNKGAVSTMVLNMLSANVQHMVKFVINAIKKTVSPMFVKQKLNCQQNLWTLFVMIPNIQKLVNYIV